MSSTAEIKDASYFGPLASASPTDGTSGNNTVRRASSSTNTSEELLNATVNGRVVYPWQGHYVDIKNESTVDALDFAFSVAAQTLVYGQTGTFAAGNVASGWRIGPGEKISVICPPTAKFANWILGAAGPSTVAMRCSDGNVGTK